MAYIAPAKDTVHFVGGLGTQADRSAINGGGATKAAWDGGSPSNFIGINGGCKHPGSTWNGLQTACTVTNNGSGKVRITRGGVFNSITDGSLANVMFAATYDDGRYEVIAHAASYIDIELTYSADTTCDTKVGGALDTLQNALDNDSTNAAAYTRSIYTNLAESVGAYIAIDTGEGSRANDTWKRVVGYDSVMVPLALGSYVAIDSAAKVFEIHNTDNFYMESIDMQPAVGSIAFESDNLPSSTCHNMVLRNCKLTNGSISLQQHKNKIIVCIECVFDTPTSTVIFSYGESLGITLINCLVKAAAGQKLFSGTGGTFQKINLIGCVFINGSYSEITGSDIGCMVLVTGCTFYNQTADVLVLNDANIFLIGFNNVFMLNDNAAGIRAFEWTAGSIGYNDYNCAYSLSGALDTTPYDNPSNQYHNLNSIEADPLMANPGSDDLRLKNGSPCYNTGITPVGTGGKTTMGSAQRKQIIRALVDSYGV